MDLYRKGVGVVLLNMDKKILVAQRIDTMNTAWQMPQGGIENNETPQEAALRELKEEIGTNKAVVISETTAWLRYSFPMNLQKSLWSGKYRGQEQKWFLMRFIGEDKDINLNTKHPEFSNWKWVKIQILEDIVIDFKKEMYKKIVREFSQTIVNLDD
jgi:putative (di)nucleoside polyphosphate hydrolase